jgi:hypothetical protein
VEHAGPPFFRAVMTEWQPSGEGRGLLKVAAAEHLGIAPGAMVWVLPLD